jgi:Hemerythrin HHE cation binding domain
MTHIADLLESDLHGNLTQLAAWAADPRASGARRRFASIIDSLILHARFMEVAVAPLIDHAGAAESARIGRISTVHQTIMSLLDRLRHAVASIQEWSAHLGILTDVVFPHLILHDHILLTTLHATHPAAPLDVLGDIFLEVKAESARDGVSAPGSHLRRASMLDPSQGPRAGRPGRYPVHHPELGLPRRPFQAWDRPGSQPGPGTARPQSRSRSCQAITLRRRSAGSPARPRCRSRPQGTRSTMAGRDRRRQAR